jgi:hypothetical protein
MGLTLGIFVFNRIEIRTIYGCAKLRTIGILFRFHRFRNVREYIRLGFTEFPVL